MARPRAISSRDPEEWQEATAQARAVRVRVADQIRDGLIEQDQTGSAGLAARRVREAAEAAQTGDRELIRSAVYEATLSLGAWLAAIDLRQEVRPPTSRAAA